MQRGRKELVINTLLSLGKYHCSTFRSHPPVQDARTTGDIAASANRFLAS